MHSLDIVVAEHCFGYDEALRMAEEIRGTLPHLEVNVTVLDVATNMDLPNVPATPAYVLNGHLIFLGNPRLKELVDTIASLAPYEVKLERT